MRVYDSDFPQLYRCKELYVSDGWLDLVYDLCYNINEEIKKSNIKDFIVSSVEESFGQLRMYSKNSNEEIDKLIKSAWKKSLTICQNCGKIYTAEIRTNLDQEYQVLCDDCMLKFNKEVEGIAET